MTQPIFPDDHTRANISAFPHPKFITRTRRETNTIDTVNARQFEHWQTAGKTYNRPDLNKQVPFYDVMPNNSRGNDQITDLNLGMKLKKTKEYRILSLINMIQPQIHEI